LLIFQIEFWESMHVRDSVSRASLRFADVCPPCRADGRAPGQIGKIVDVAGRIPWAHSTRGLGDHPESAALNAIQR
jgi:hypothetical protein